MKDRKQGQGLRPWTPLRAAARRTPSLRNGVPRASGLWRLSARQRAPVARGIKGRALALLFLLLSTGASQAQSVTTTPSPSVKKDEPVFYQADRAIYDRDAGLVTLDGKVEFWQGDRILLADRVTYDRNTRVAAATGHVVLLEPNGQTVFSDYAELTEGMKDGILIGMRAILAENGRLAANSARRTDARINELSRAVYSTCDLCRDDPSRPPLWQIRAREAVQDTENRMIEYRDAVVDFFGFPVLYLPYLTHPDPSAKRVSGWLVPGAGYSKHLGGFTQAPYYWVIDGQSDATITPLLATRNGPQIDVAYRRRFNDGTVSVNASVAGDRGDGAAHLFTKGQFAIDDTWRWGFDINRASSINYLRDFRIAGGRDVLASEIYLEGFGEGAYTKLDTKAYQPLTTTRNYNRLPYVLPRYAYSFFGEPDSWGGRLSAEAGAFNVVRYQGSNVQRGRLSLGYDLPVTGRLGDVWAFTMHLDSAVYAAQRFNEQPNYGVRSAIQSAQGMPTAAVLVRWPLMRVAGSWGTQILEPIMQLVVAPRGSAYGATTLIPNEDSLLPEFTDANLFALNRFPGVDRLEGGVRANVALHGAWYLAGGTVLDAQLGQAFRLRRDTAFRADSGLRDTASDIVGHFSVTPTAYFDLTTRGRLDRKTMQVKFADVLATVGPSWLRASGGYLYTSTNPYTFFDTPPPIAPTKPRNEIELALRTNWGHWRADVNGRRDLRSTKMVSIGAGGAYEDECFIFDVHYYRRYTSINNDGGSSTILFQITLKTVGQFGFHAL